MLPLTPAGVQNNQIDIKKLLSFMEVHRAGHDFSTIAASDLQGLADMYANSPFRVAAFLKAGRGVAENTFFALPEDVLGLPAAQAW